jgi:hypothetical protein
MIGLRSRWFGFSGGSQVILDLILPPSAPPQQGGMESNVSVDAVGGTLLGLSTSGSPGALHHKKSQPRGEGEPFATGLVNSKSVFRLALRPPPGETAGWKPLEGQFSSEGRRAFKQPAYRRPSSSINSGA